MMILHATLRNFVVPNEREIIDENQKFKSIIPKYGVNERRHKEQSMRRWREQSINERRHKEQSVKRWRGQSVNERRHKEQSVKRWREHID
jgi:hypothetical protein